MKWRSILIVSLYVFSSLVIGSLAQEDPNCPGAPTPQLGINGQGRVTPGDANNVRDIPAKSGTKTGEIPGGEIFNVLEGPTCADGLNWWRVSYKDLTGWTVEGQGMDYWVEAYDPDLPTNTPVPPTAIPTETPIPAPAQVFEPPRPVVNVLESGVQARVISDDPLSYDIRLALRSSASVNAEIVSYLNAGDLVTVLDDVQEADGLIWRKIETSDARTGWVTEGLLSDKYPSFRRTLLPLCPYTEDRLVFPFSDYIYTANFDGSDACIMDLLRFSQNISFFAIDWLPDRSSFAFLDQRETDMFSLELFTISADGSQRQKLSGDGRVTTADWSPDGGRLLIAQRQIWTMRTDGSANGALTSGSGSKKWGAWLADSETLLYSDTFAQPFTQVAITRLETVYYRVNVVSGGLTELLRTDLQISTTQLSPDRSKLLIQGWEPIPIEGTEYVEHGKFKTLLIDAMTGEITDLANNMPFRLFWLSDSSGFFSYVGDELSYVPSLSADYVDVPISRPIISYWNFTPIEWLPNGQLAILNDGDDISSRDDDELVSLDVKTGLVKTLIAGIDSE